MNKSKLNKFIKNPGLLFASLGHRGFLNWMSDTVYLKILYFVRLGKRLDLNNPQTFNEKLQWLKLYDRNPLYTTLVDKYAVKKWVAGKIGAQYIIPTLGIWDKFEEIDFEKLPNQFVLKCTHDSGGIVICRDKQSFDKKRARRILNNCLRHNFFWCTREWPYKNVPPRIIAEKYMQDEKTQELRDYKFFCFGGITKTLFVASDRYHLNEETKFDFFDVNFVHLPFTNGHPNALLLPEKPQCFEEMKNLAKILSAGMPHVRIDFYEINGKVYFGEITFFHWSGLMPFNPEKWDYTFGSWLKLPKKEHSL